MKLILEINSIKLLLSPTQIEAIADILHGVDHLEHKYMGSRAPSEYIDSIRQIPIRDVLKVHVMSDIEYDALVFITKQQDTNKE
jgi:hypothetical protein